MSVEFDAGFFERKLPVDGSLGGITLGYASREFGEGRDTLVQALADDGGELEFNHIEPGGVFGLLVHLEAGNANTVAFGSIALPGLGTSTSQDAFVAKFTDAGTSAAYTWAVAGGGASTDQATALAASGTSVYVASNFINNAANANTVTFGSTATTLDLHGLATDIYYLQVRSAAVLVKKLVIAK